MTVEYLSGDRLAAALRSPRDREDLSPAFGVPAVVVPLEDVPVDDPVFAAPPPIASVVIGVARGGPPTLAALEVCDVAFTTRGGGRAAAPMPRGLDAALAGVLERIESWPQAACMLVSLLRRGARLSVEQALNHESAVYSLLQTGPEFDRWLQASATLRASAKPDREVPIRVTRRGGQLDVVLSRPRVHNAFNVAMRDALAETMELAIADRSIRRIALSGVGASFCSGGDLSEFGSQSRGLAGHFTRMTRSVGRLLHENASRTVATVHGATIGAGIELVAFAARVQAQPDTAIALPEVGFGLVPGAGGTVSLPRRIGRHRAAWLALTGQTIDASLALDWGLVDELVDDHNGGGADDWH